MRISRGSFLVSVVAALATAVPGGLTGGCGAGTPADSTYQGSYRATYAIPQANESGTFNYTVDRKGGMTGSLVDTQTSTTRGFSGTLRNDGHFNGQVTEPGGGAASATMNGTLASSGVPGGDFVMTKGGAEYRGTFTLTDGTTPVTQDSPFVGAYRGTYGIPENHESGNVSFTVDSRGQLTGFFSQSNNTPVGTFSGTVLFDGNFSGDIRYPDTGEVRTFRMGKLAPSKINSGGLSGDFVLQINGAPRSGNFEVTVGASEVDSVYQGTYGGVAGVSGGFSLSNPPANTLPARGDVNVTVDKEGDIAGTMAGQRLAGRITNDGRFSGTLGGYVVSGKLSHQQIAELITDPNDGKMSVQYKDGVAGNFAATINGADYLGSFQMIGGLQKN